MDSKKLVMIFSILLFISLVLPFAHSGTKSVDKTDAQVARAVSANQPVKVIVTLKDKTEKKFGVLSLGLENVSKDNVIGDAGINKNSVKKFLYSNSFAAQLTPNEIKKLEQDSRVKKISYDYPVHAFLQNSLLLIGANDTWNLQVNGTNLTGADESVCILDTGVDYNHTDLGGGWGNKVIAGFRYLGSGTDKQDCSTNHSACFDDNGHGTHVAGIVAANGSIKGVAPDAKIVAIKVLDSSGVGYTSDIISGIEWCVHNATKFNISAISMSLGTSNLYNSYCDLADPATTDAINSAVAENVSVVIASGNDANYTDISFPSCIQNASAIGAVYDGDFGGLTWGNNTCTDTTTSTDKITCFTDRNSLLKLLAPGALINSTWNNGGYKQEGGTSMATPYVAGAISIINQYLKSRNQTKTPGEIEGILQDTGKKINDTSETSLNFSRINIYDAILYLDSNGPTVSLTSPANNTYTNISAANFTCTENSGLHNLVNTTFSLWNSTSLIYNETKNISGTSNTTTFNYTFQNETSYLWNCKSYDDNFSASATSNYTITYDATAPNITLVGPANGTNYTGTTNVSFLYNVSDANINECNLTINGSVTNTNNSINTSITNNFTKSLAAGNYSWSIGCNDLAGNYNTTETRNITINATTQVQTPAPAPSGGGGGGGGYVPTPTTYKVNISVPEGSTQKIKSGDSLSFSSDGIDHTLTLTGFQNSAAFMTIRSNPINISLKANQTTKLDLNSDNYYDLQITLNSIQGDYANLTLKGINESIPTVHILSNETQNTSTSENQTQTNNSTRPVFTEKNTTGLIIVLVILTILFLMPKIKRKFKEKRLESYLKKSPVSKSQEYLKSSDAYSSNGKSSKGKASG